MPTAEQIRALPCEVPDLSWPDAEVGSYFKGWQAALNAAADLLSRDDADGALPVTEEAMPEHLPPGRRDRTSRMSSSWRNQRSETPAGFAKAFFEANQ